LLKNSQEGRKKRRNPGKEEGRKDRTGPVGIEQEQAKKKNRFPSAGVAQTLGGIWRGE